MNEKPIITEEFVQKYKNKKPNWGFNGLGYIVYKRTYARKLEDGSTEEWYQTVARCINGAQKIGARYNREEAERLYDHIFNLRCLFAGRMLWQLGTPTVDKFFANSLVNCWMLQINEPKSFLFLFENLMLGGGVGFSIRKEDVHELPKIKKNVCIIHKNTKDADFIVPDSREGWVALLEKFFDAFFVSGRSFSYSTILVRGAGEPIRGFGGTASGPQILIDGITKISKILLEREGKKLRSIDCLDICNIIGSIVVAGNVRRSALIALGDPDDILFLRAKNWSKGNIPNWRAMSNNTIYADSFDHIMSEIWQNGYETNKETQIANGEPYGFFNLPLSERFGRIKDGPVKDSNLYPINSDTCVGLNPCQPGWATVLTKKGIAKFSDINIGDEIWSESGWTKIINKQSSGIKEVFGYKTNAGIFYGTKNHRVVSNGQKIEARFAESIDALSTGDKEINILLPNLINEVETFGEHEVFDITVDNETHTYWTGGLNVSNCGEIPLSNYECCNLSELCLNNIESKEQLIDCAKLLYKTQKAISAMPFLHEETNKIVHKNMRLGLGVTGICQSLDKVEWLDDCYIELRKFDKLWSKINEWPESIKLTTVKPSGTLSLLSGSTPGVHPAYSNFYIRRVRMSSSDPLVSACKEKGYKTEYAVGFDGKEDRATIIVSFPCCVDKKTIVSSKMKAVEQLELVKQIQSIWSDNAVSCTVYYREEELDQIKDWLKENYEKNIKSVSFLLHNKHGFSQAPYEEIEEENYKKMLSGIDSIKTVENYSDLVLEECSNGACPVK